MNHAPIIYVTVDVALFRKKEETLELLLIQRLNEPYKNMWALPGGFVDKNEDLETAAKRELFEETNVRIFQIQQIKAYGNPDRDPRGHTVSIAFFGSTDLLTEAKAKDDAKALRWFSIEELPVMAFDHNEIVRDAIEKYLR